MFILRRYHGRAIESPVADDTLCRHDRAGSGIESNTPWETVTKCRNEK
jgi:hypothetical protein